MENEISTVYLAFIKSRILTLNDVHNFCLKEGNILFYYIFRIIFPRSWRFYSRVFL